MGAQIERDGHGFDAGVWLEEAVIAPRPEAPGGPLVDLWALRSLHDAYRPRPPQQHVIDGLLLLPSLNIVYGAPGSLKSMLLADAAVCVAGGLPWLPPLSRGEGRALPTLRAPVLWLDFDNGARRSDERFDALARARRLPPHTPLHYVSMPSPWLDASQRTMVELLVPLIAHLGARLIVIDNLGLVAGNVDENSADMARVMGNLRWLCEETESALVVVHHQRKSTGARHGRAGNGRKGDSLRGHSSIEAALDLALLIEREMGSDTVTLTPTKVRGVDVFPFAALFTYQHGEGSRELAEARFWGQELEDLSSDRAIDRAIVEALQRQPLLNKSSLAEAARDIVEAGTNRVRARIDVLAETGKIKQSSGSGAAKFYSLP